MSTLENTEQRLRLDKETCMFIQSNYSLLNENMKVPFTKFYNLLKARVHLTPAQHNYLDGMYECVMGKLTGQKVDLHIDLKNKHKQHLKY